MVLERPARVILVDDDPQSRSEVECLLRRAGLIVHACQEAGEALDALAQGPRPNVVVSHAQLRGTSELSLLLAVHALDSRLPVVLTSRFASVPMAAEAMRQGAFDFIAWPCLHVTLLAAVQAAIEAGSGSIPSQEASVSRLR